MREQGVILKNGIDLPLVRRDMMNRLSMEINRSLRRFDKPGNQPQNRRLPAPRRPKQRIKLPALHRKTDVIQYDRAVVFLRHSLEADDLFSVHFQPPVFFMFTIPN